MSFGDSITICLKKYGEFRGRASRPEYWWFFLFYILCYIAAGIVGAAIEVIALAPLALLGLFLPLLSAAVRRLHDGDRSGWWYLISLVPLVGGIILIVFLATEGNATANRYGPAPGGLASLASNVPPPPIPPPPS